MTSFARRFSVVLWLVRIGGRLSQKQLSLCPAVWGCRDDATALATRCEYDVLHRSFTPDGSTFIAADRESLRMYEFESTILRRDWFS